MILGLSSFPALSKLAQALPQLGVTPAVLQVQGNWSHQTPKNPRWLHALEDLTEKMAMILVGPILLFLDRPVSQRQVVVVFMMIA